VARQVELARANQNLARLETLARDTSDAERTLQQTQALARLGADEAPAPAWIAVLGLGFCSALAGLALFAFQGVDRAGNVALGRARFGLLLFLIGAACWTFAAYRA
jgi:hypothetical protein